MQIKSAVFHSGARSAATAPAWEFPEFAFIGRSNVGKSSLVNMLTHRNGLAKVSATPGKTRMLNFFVINQAWCLVDLPGYGYAKVPRGEKFDFNESAGDYLEQRENLRLAFVLIDSRLTPQRIDLDFITWLGDTGVPFALIFTKADKQSPAKTRAAVQAFLDAMPSHLAGVPQVIISSSKDGAGRGEILRRVQQAMED